MATDPARFPSDEAVRAAHRTPYDPGRYTEAMLVAAYAVDEPKIRADERAKVIAEVVEWVTWYNADEVGRVEKDDPFYVVGTAIEREFGTERKSKEETHE